MSLNDIVNVTISRQTATVSRAGFGYAMMLGVHKRTLNRVDWYSSTAAMITDGFESTDQEYIAAVDHFAQDPRPTQFAVGRIQASRVNVTIATVVDSTDYTIYVESATAGTPTAFTHNSGIGATTSSIVAALVVLIDAGAEPVDATDADPDVQIDGDATTTPFVITVNSSTLMTVGAPAGTIEDDSDALDAIILEDSDWYGLVLCDRTSANVQDVAAWTESNRKLFVTASADANIINQTLAADTTSIAKLFKDLSYARTAVMYQANAATEYPDAAWLGKVLPYDAGSLTWCYKTLASVTVDSLTETQQNNARDKNANVYITVGGRNITFEGTVADNEFIDIIRGIDWLYSEIQANVYGRLVNLPKIPYTDAGIATIEAMVRTALSDGVDSGFLASYTTTVPAAADCSAADKTARILRDVEFTAVVAGAIHTVIITGVVTV